MVKANSCPAILLTFGHIYYYRTRLYAVGGFFHKIRLYAGMWVLLLQFGHKQRLAALLELFNISRRRLYLQQGYITAIQLYCINCDFSKEFANNASRLKKAK